MTNIKTVLSGVVNVQLATIQKLNRVNDNLVSGYYTKAETHQVIASSGFLQKQVCATEPATAKENTIYFIPSGVSIQSSKNYKEYIKINNQWCKIGGDQPPDLTPYLRKDQDGTIAGTLTVQNLNVNGKGTNPGSITTDTISSVNLNVNEMIFASGGQFYDVHASHAISAAYGAIDQFYSPNAGFETLNVASAYFYSIGTAEIATTGLIKADSISAKFISGGTVSINSINSQNYSLNNNALNSAGGLAKVEANGYVPSTILDPAILGKIDSITLNNGNPQQIVNRNVNLDVIQQPLSAVVGYYLQKTASGWVTDPGISTVQQQITSVTDNKIQVKNTTIPVMLKTNKGNIYPIQKNVLSEVGNYFYIDIHPFLVYDNSAAFDGTWKVYYGAGVAQRNTNTVYTGIVVDGIYNGNYQFGDIHKVSVSGATQIQVSNIPLGQGMSIRIHNTGNNVITFGSATEIITQAGDYIVPFGNFNGNIELIGGAIALFS